MLPRSFRFFFFFSYFLAAFTGMRNILWGWPSIQACHLNLEGSNFSHCFLLRTSCYQIHQQSSEDNHQTSDQSWKAHSRRHLLRDNLPFSALTNHLNWFFFNLNECIHFPYGITLTDQKHGFGLNYMRRLAGRRHQQKLDSTSKWGLHPN